MKGVACVLVQLVLVLVLAAETGRSGGSAAAVDYSSVEQCRTCVSAGQCYDLIELRCVTQGGWCGLDTARENITYCDCAFRSCEDCATVSASCGWVTHCSPRFGLRNFAPTDCRCLMHSLPATGCDREGRPLRCDAKLAAHESACSSCLAEGDCCYATPQRIGGAGGCLPSAYEQYCTEFDGCPAVSPALYGVFAMSSLLGLSCLAIVVGYFLKNVTHTGREEVVPDGSNLPVISSDEPTHLAARSLFIALFVAVIAMFMNELALAAGSMTAEAFQIVQLAIGSLPLVGFWLLIIYSFASKPGSVWALRLTLCIATLLIPTSVALSMFLRDGINSSGFVALLFAFCEAGLFGYAAMNSFRIPQRAYDATVAPAMSVGDAETTLHRALWVSLSTGCVAALIWNITENGGTEPYEGSTKARLYTAIDFGSDPDSTSQKFPAAYAFSLYRVIAATMAVAPRLASAGCFQSYLYLSKRTESHRFCRNYHLCWTVVNLVWCMVVASAVELVPFGGWGYAGAVATYVASFIDVCIVLLFFNLTGSTSEPVNNDLSACNSLWARGWYSAAMSVLSSFFWGAAGLGLIMVVFELSLTFVLLWMLLAKLRFEKLPEGWGGVSVCKTVSGVVVKSVPVVITLALVPARDDRDTYAYAWDELQDRRGHIDFDLGSGQQLPDRSFRMLMLVAAVVAMVLSVLAQIGLYSAFRRREQSSFTSSDSQ